MGKNELRELRKQAEQAIANTHRVAAIGSPTVIGHAAIAKAIMYVGELLADRLDQGQYNSTESAIPICTDGDCSDAQYHADHSALDPNIYTMSKELSRTRAINAEMLEALAATERAIRNGDLLEGPYSSIVAVIAKAKGEAEPVAAEAAREIVQSECIHNFVMIKMGMGCTKCGETIRPSR